MSPLKNNEKGMVLLLVLVVIVLLTSLVTEFSFSTFVEFRLTETFRDSTKAYYLGKGGLQAGRMVLQSDTNDYDALTETWALPWSNFPVTDGTVSLKIEDLDGKLNINRLVNDQGDANNQLKNRFLLFLENMDIPEPDKLTDALIDWIDPDDDPRPFGEENSFYLREKSYSCKNGPLDTLEELTRVKGFTPEIFGKIIPFLSVYGSDKINVNTAGEEVLMSLSNKVDSESANRIVEYRQDSPFQKLIDLKDVPGLEESVYLTFKPLISLKSQYFRISSTGHINNSRKKIQAIVQKDKNRLLSLKVE